MSKKTLLLVDDNPIVLQVLQAALEDAGYEVIALSSAFKINAAIAERRPDLMVLDVNMPALRGDKAAAILRRRSFAAQIPILLISDTDEAELAELALETGVAGYVRKANNPTTLLEAVDQHLARSTAD